MLQTTQGLQLFSALQLPDEIRVESIAGSTVSSAKDLSHEVDGEAAPTKVEQSEQ